MRPLDYWDTYLAMVGLSILGDAFLGSRGHDPDKGLLQALLESLFTLILFLPFAWVLMMIQTAVLT